MNLLLTSLKKCNLMRTCKVEMNKAINKIVVEMMNQVNMMMKVVKMIQTVRRGRKVIENHNLIKKLFQN